MEPTPFDPARATGLSEAEAVHRQRIEGFNEMPQGARRGVTSITLEVMREPMFLLLVGCGSLYLLMGELSDALLLLGFVFVVMGITVIQERRTERALEALRDLSSPRALVIRDGQQRRIAGREVVRGDLVLLGEGDRVPADAVLRHALNLFADESLLTGESLPVRKSSSRTVTEAGQPGGGTGRKSFRVRSSPGGRVWPRWWPQARVRSLARSARRSSPSSRRRRRCRARRAAWSGG